MFRCQKCKKWLKNITTETDVVYDGTIYHATNVPAKICPECGKEYSSRPALSRKDNKTMICPKCGMMEALDTVRNFYAPGMTDQQWKRYKEEYMLKYIKEN